MFEGNVGILFWEIFLNGNCFEMNLGSKKALNTLQSLENNPDDAGHIIRIHFRVSKVMDGFPSMWLWYCLD